MKPMLAQSYKDKGHLIKYPAFIQPKLDGFRCVAVKHENEVILYLRSGETMNNVPHINRALNTIMADGDVLDGELYKHGIHFDQLSGDLRAEDGRNTQYIEYHIYDHPIVMNDRDYKQHERVTQLMQYRDNGLLIAPLAYVDTYLVEDEAHMYRGLDHFTKLGYEGVMVRNMDGVYAFGKRPRDLQKVKPLFDAEFEIVDIEEGKGDHQGMAGRFKVKGTMNGKKVTFFTNAFGTHDNRRKMLAEWPKDKGAMVTIEYYELTKSNKPRYGGSVKGIRWDK